MNTILYAAHVYRRYIKVYPGIYLRYIPIYLRERRYRWLSHAAYNIAFRDRICIPLIMLSCARRGKRVGENTESFLTAHTPSAVAACRSSDGGNCRAGRDRHDLSVGILSAATVQSTPRRAGEEGV